MVIICLSVATILLTLTSVLVMAEEFHQLPESLQRISTALVDNRTSRTALICGVIITMAFASSLSLVLNTDSTTSTTTNDTRIISPILASITLKANRNFTESKRMLDENLVVNMSLSATVYHNSSDDSGGGSYDFIEYNCTGDCIKSVVNVVGLRNLITNSSGNHTLPKRSTENSAHQLLRAYSNISSTGVITSTYDDCPHPEYIVFTWVLCMIALATALKLYYLIKLFLAIVMVAIYTDLILLPYNHVFSADYINAEE